MVTAAAFDSPRLPSLVAFTDVDFLFCFLPAVWALHSGAGRMRNLALTAASLLFYALGAGSFTAFVLISIAGNYWLARAIERHRAHSTHHAVLTFGILANLGALAWLKYAGFVADNLNLVLVLFHWPPLPVPTPALPIGISFFTFHAISYLVDVSRQHATAQKRPVEAALYLLLFPQLVAGPIVRYREIASQLTSRQLSLDATASGLRRFSIGLAKKMLVANTVAAPADAIFAMPANQVGPELAWLGMVCYTLQIYFDFSGYSDMAVGLGQLFGFTLPENFRYPYAAQTIQDFWRRWHITLSAWFRDYLYVPLGGNRRGRQRELLNLLTVFFLCGLWHGASWTFVVWGLFHGAFLVFERLRPLGGARGPWRVVRHVYVVLVVMIGWVFFRADTMNQAWQWLQALAGRPPSEAPTQLASSFLSSPVILALLAGALGSTPLTARMWQWMNDAALAPSRAWAAPLRWSLAVGRMALVLALLGSSLLFASATTYNPFIYFRF